MNGICLAARMIERRDRYVYNRSLMWSSQCPRDGEEQGMTNATVENSSAASSDPVVGAIGTDVHLYHLPNGMASVVPYIPASWRRTLEMRDTVDHLAVRATARTTSHGVRV